MNMAEIMEQVHKKGRDEEAFRLITEYVPKLSTDAKKEFCYKLEGIAYALTPEEAKQIVSHMIPYKYVDGRFREFEAAIASQAVQNQANKDSFQILQERLDCAKKECECAINAETRARKCADDIIVNYTNATFYPKMVADVTTGTTTTAQSVYNPLPACSCKSC